MSDGTIIMAILAVVGGGLLGIGMRRIEKKLENIDRVVTESALHKQRLDGLDGMSEKVAQHEVRIGALERAA